MNKKKLIGGVLLVMAVILLVSSVVFQDTATKAEEAPAGTGHVAAAFEARYPQEEETPVIIPIAIIMGIGGLIFLLKAKDSKFLPGI